MIFLQICIIEYIASKLKIALREKSIKQSLQTNRPDLNRGHRIVLALVSTSGKRATRNIDTKVKEIHIKALDRTASCKMKFSIQLVYVYPASYAIWYAI